MARAYVSSTYNDLQECREQVRLALRRTGHEDVAMEYYVVEDKRPLDRCLEDVASCDLYIGIFAWRYGYIPEGYDKSITEMEFRKAVETGKDCLIFLLKQDAPWPVDRIEFSAIDKINALRDELGKDYLAGFFRNKDELRIQVVEAIHEWEKEHGIDSSKCTDWEAYREAINEEYRWVRLSVIAGAARDRIARIPLADVFVSQMAAADKPSYDISEETIALKRTLFQAEAEGEEELDRFDLPLTPSYEEGENGEKGIISPPFPGREGGPGGLGPESIPEPILNLLGRETTQVILGGPGSGKSTLLHYTLLALSSNSEKKRLPQLPSVSLPFLIELRQYVLKKAANFIDYMVKTAQETYGFTLTADAVQSLFNNEPDRVLLL